MNNSKSFLGTGWGFPPTFDGSLAAVQMVSEQEDIAQSLYILLSTYPGERITNLSYGCDLRQIAFEPFSPATESKTRDAISLAVLFYEPRVKLDAIEFDTSSEPDGLLLIKLYYTIIRINVRYNIVYPFYKIEGTDIKDPAFG